MNAILLHRVFARVQKILLIAFRTCQLAGLHVQTGETRRFGGVAHDGDGFFVKRFVRDDAPGANLFAAQFELRLHQDEKVGARFGYDAAGGKTFPAEIKDTSTMTRSTGSGISLAASSLALRSMRTTRGSWRISRRSDPR